ncbi:NRDE family protein [Chitinophaga sp. S165]|uniref:NRDE family protein n=1 Tax=Chitinophaga sp. S165 TaxID=2135462 RepID=UPI000D70D030|nr:NRDE family protein [Chitinophaga sp. S165]PWV53986.1 transport and Golgi organization protein 2 [Chitinophaga sp. S165]
MCTVTFIPTASGIHLTSNRDEQVNRGRAIDPAYFSGDGYKLVFPKDPDAGGSWIALKDNGDALVLLNGAFIKHLRKPPYRRSRGQIVLDIIKAADPEQQFNEIDLEGIEPFTLVLFTKGVLWECRWDGFGKHRLLLDAGTAYIWSSVTLYDDEETLERRQWFRDWLDQRNDRISTEEIFSFHQHAGKGDVRNSLVMNRENKVRTVSITSILIGGSQLRMRYRDLQSGSDAERSFSRKNSLADRKTTKLLSAVRRAIIRARHWEYWPSYMIYGPLYFYWLWLSIKARSFFFFSAANPGIENSGFAQERKSDIYKLIPQRYYPQTALYQAGATPEAVIRQLKERGMTFPLIAKPDMGERGVQVKLLYTIADLENYCRLSKVDFIVQEYIDYELEAGIFYYRIPGEQSGHISGIVGKEFLSVTGDGRSTIAMLLEKQDRALLQLPSLRQTEGSVLDVVLEAGISRLVVPYGNHSRGALFVDLSEKITESLTREIDAICKQIPGFYYGRLDIKFKSWEALNKGADFSIIELNGAGSEPTHIYDPSHSLFFAWKEVCRHWRLLYCISRLNVKKKGLSLMNIAEGMKMLQSHTRHLKQVRQL